MTININKKLDAKRLKSWQFLKEVFNEWYNNNAMSLSAALSFYTIFSLPPLLIIIIFVAGLVWGTDAVEGKIVSEIQSLIGKDGAIAIQTILKNARRPDISKLASIVGIVTLIVASTGVFAQLQYSLNTIWNVKVKSSASWYKVIFDRLLSFTMVLSIGFLLIVSLVINALLSAFDDYISSFLYDSVYLYYTQLANFIVSFMIITLMFAMIYKYLPDVKITWKDVFSGAVVTSALFALGRYLIGLYIGNSNVGTSYGAAGSVIVTFIWIFYATLIFFFGAEFTQVYARHYGSRIVPDEHAEFIRALDIKDPNSAEFVVSQKNEINKELFSIPIFLIKKKDLSGKYSKSQGFFFRFLHLLKLRRLFHFYKNY